MNMLKLNRCCLDQAMADNSSKRKKDSVPWEGVFQEQPWTNAVIYVSLHGPSKSLNKVKMWIRTKSNSLSSSRTRSPRRRSSKHKYHMSMKRGRHHTSASSSSLSSSSRSPSPIPTNKSSSWRLQIINEK